MEKFSITPKIYQQSASPSVGLYGVMIKLIRINETTYINPAHIMTILITDENIKIFTINDKESWWVIKAGEGYYKTARKALGV